MAMRFTAKGSLAYLLCGLLFLGMAVFYSVPWRHHSGFSLWMGALWYFNALLNLSTYFLTYWELLPDGLHARALWRRQRISYENITRVGLQYPDRPKSTTLDIEYGHLDAAIFPHAHVMANPQNPQRFVEILRSRATVAEFLI